MTRVDVTTLATTKYGLTILILVQLHEVGKIVSDARDSNNVYTMDATKLIKKKMIITVNFERESPRCVLGLGNCVWGGSSRIIRLVAYI